MTTLDNTRHCPMCEDAAKKILELEQRVKVLTEVLGPFVREARDYVSGGNKQLIKMVRNGERALNQTPQQTAAQIERGHIEWMMKLPVAAIVGLSATSSIVVAYGDQVIPCLLPRKPEVIMLGNLDVGLQLVAIPPLPKESKE